MRIAELCRAALLVLVVAAPSAARADEPAATADEPAPTTFERIDAAFGEWLVAPLSTVMFFDLVRWDDTLPAGEGVGTDIGDERVTAWEPTRGYVYRARSEAPVAGLVPALDAPVTRQMGELVVEIDDEGAQLVGRVGPQSVDLARLGIAPVPEGTDPATVSPLTTSELAPFPVAVDALTGQTIETTVLLPPDTLPVAPGMKVHHGPELLEVASIEAGRAVLLGAERASAAPLPNPSNRKLPFIVAWLVAGAVFFTFRMAFVNLRAFGHALRVTAGQYDDPSHPGEVTHFQALSSALSATVGLGNIAGVAIAVSVGGPGAVIWMIIAAFFGMSSKFTECSLGQMYRVVRPDGSVSGGPMHYLDVGLREMGFGVFGKGLAVLFALMCIGGSLGGGNMFQANQSYAAISQQIPFFADRAWAYGLLLALLVGLVILGGIRRIAAVASLIVPIMCGVYVVAGLYVLAVNATAIPDALGAMFAGAFSPSAGFGGVLGVLVAGFQRASFSNEAGVGSASIAHSAAATDEPIREGIVALLEPFIDTVLVCTMTGLVVVVTGAYAKPGVDGVVMTSNAFASAISWFPIVLSFTVFLFAFSTMISWSYYGERCVTWLLGEWAKLPYRLLFLVFVFFGSVFKLGNVLDFSDLMVLGMAFPNILGAVLLSGKVKRALDTYLGKLARDEFAPRTQRSA